MVVENARPDDIDLEDVDVAGAGRQDLLIQGESRSVEELGVETILTSLPVFLAHASAPDLQTVSSMPTAPQEIDTLAPHAPATRVKLHTTARPSVR